MKVSTKLWITRNQNNIGIGIIILLVVATLVWAASPPENNSGSREETSNSRLQSSEKSYDFGTISMAAGKVSHVFQVRNDENDSIIVKKLYTSCMCTSATMMRGTEKYGPFGMQGHGAIPSINQTLSGGEQVDVEVVFDPAAHGPAGVGRISRIVYLENNAGKPLELKFSAMVTP